MELIKFKGATLLSSDDILGIPPMERDLGDAWWLRDEGEKQEDGICTAYAVNEDGSDLAMHDTDLNHLVRPAIILDTFVADGEVFHVNGHSFMVVCDGKYALAATAIGRSVFREQWGASDAGNYETSDVKKSVDSWYRDNIEGNEAGMIAEYNLSSKEKIDELEGLCVEVSDEVFESERTEKLLKAVDSLLEAIREYKECPVTKKPDIPDEQPRKDHYMDKGGFFECDVREIVNYHHTGYKDHLVQTHHVEAPTRRKLCEKIYSFERSSRYDSARRYDIVEDDIRSLYRQWKDNGGVTMEVYYGGGIVD